MNKIQIKKRILQALYLMTAVAVQSAHAKTIQFENSTRETVNVHLPHFTSMTGVDRYPTMSEFRLNSGEIQKVYVKPYQYAGSIYLPNSDWVLDAEGDDAEEERREDVIRDDYSFGKSDNVEKRHSIKIVDTKAGHLLIPVTDIHIGELVQHMAESPEENPDDGFELVEGGPTGLRLRVTAGNDIELYDAVPEK